MALTKVQALRQYFDLPGRPLKFQEMKELSAEELTELAEQAAEELGEELK